MILVNHNYNFLEHQLPRSQKAQRGLAPLSGVALLGGNYGEVVKTGLKRQEQIGYISVLEPKHG